MAEKHVMPIHDLKSRAQEILKAAENLRVHTMSEKNPQSSAPLSDILLETIRLLNDVINEIRK